MRPTDFAATPDRDFKAVNLIVSCGKSDTSAGVQHFGPELHILDVVDPDK